MYASISKDNRYACVWHALCAHVRMGVAETDIFKYMYVVWSHQSTINGYKAGNDSLSSM